ncbi:MAG: EGF domain-containing protein [Pseudomonadota bacterium]
MFRIICDFDRLVSRFRTTTLGVPLVAVLLALAAGCGGGSTSTVEINIGGPDVGEPDAGEPEVREPDVREPDVREPDVCSVCTPAAVCEPGSASPCTCPDGFEGDGTQAGTGCTDIDECEEGLADCLDAPGECTNTDGGFTCGCEPGYEGDGTAEGSGCTDIDECGEGTDDCVEAHGMCTNTEGGVTCGCEEGYGGDGTSDGTGCTDVDECQEGTDHCVEDSAICTNTDGGYTCACKDGYEGDGSLDGTGCTDMDECALGMSDCMAELASCDNIPGGYECECLTGYQGDGTADGTGCTDIDECDIDTDDCVDSPAGTCANTVGAYSCGCGTGYEGDGVVGGTGCTDIDECDLGIADCDLVLASCANTIGGFLCVCEAGYEGDGQLSGTGCVDIDECQTGVNDCVDAPAGTCANTVGAYTCGCEAGYLGDGIIGGAGCVDIDECAEGTDDCMDAPGLCINVGGGYTCDCQPGYEGDGTQTGTGCVDIDECAIGTDECIEAPGICINTVGGYTCACEDGYEGDGLPVESGGTGCVLQNPRLTVPTRMVNDKPLTLRAEILIDETQIDLSGCFDNLGTVAMIRLSDGEDIPLTVTFFDDHLPVPEDSIRFYHGVGSVSFTLDDGAAVPPGDYQVIVTVNGLTAVKKVTVLDDPVWRVMPATLTGEDLVWGPNENIRISAHHTAVPAGSTLTILPGTLIMVDTLGSLENGTLINVHGNMEAVGTLGNPIAFFSEMGAQAMIHTVSGSLSNIHAWRGFNLWGSDSSVIKWVMLTGAGNGDIISHPRPPIWSMRQTSNAVFEDCVFVDSTGMMFMTPGTGNYVIRRTLVSRTGIGGEFLASGHTMLIEDSFWTGIGRGPNTPLRYDGDGLHIDGLYSDQTIRRCIIADVGDDCIDHSNSTFLIEDTVIHDCKDKANSMTAGLGIFNNVLMFNTGTGIRGTGQVFDSTIAASSPIDNPQVVQSSIIWPSSLWTCSGEIDYTLVGNPGDLSCGDGNLSADPLFADPDNCDFTLAEGSPALTAGPNGEPIGWLGYPVIAPWMD